MAKIWTEEEVERLERQRELQDRARAANPTAGMSFHERQRYKWEQERKLDDDRFRASHGGLSRAEVAAAGPNGSGRQYAAIKRGFELQAAREHEMKTRAAELATREEEARQKRFGMENQGLGAARVRAEADRDIAGRNLADKDLQRKHELEMLGQTQTFQGTQAEAERKNKLKIADVQGKSAVATAREQAAARAAELAGRNDVEREKIEARRRAVDQRAQTEANKELGRSFRALLAQRDPAGRSSLSDEEKATLEQLLKKMGL